MKVYIIDYRSVGAEGVREIEKDAAGDAVFFITGDPTRLPVQINSILDRASAETEEKKKPDRTPAAEKKTPVENKPSAEKKTLSENRPEPEKKQDSKQDNKASKIASDVLNRARNAFAPKEDRADAEEKKTPDKKTEKKPEKKAAANLTDEQKKKLKEAVKPAGLKAIEYARLYKSVAESADKNEYNIALTRSFKVQKKANDIYRLTRPVFEEIKGN